MPRSTARCQRVQARSVDGPTRLTSWFLNSPPEATMKKFLIAAAMLLWSALTFAAVNVNTASQAELEALNGIGPVKAKAIIDDRAKNGPYKSIDDLDRVKGIGKATIEKLRNDISVSGATSMPAAD